MSLPNDRDRMPDAIILPPFPIHERHTNSLKLIANVLAGVVRIGAEPMTRM